MITVNLLPISAFKQRLKGRIFLTALMLMVIIGLAGIASIKMVVLDNNLASMQKQDSDLDKSLAKLKTQVAEAEKNTKLTVRKWKQLSAVVELEERRRDQTRLLTEVERLVPKDSAWLTSMDHRKGKLDLKGISKDKDTISEFLTRLQGATYLDRNSVFPGEISQKLRLNNLLLTTFSIRADTKFPEPVIIIDGMEKFNLPSAQQFSDLVKAAAPDLAAGILPGSEAPAPATGRRR